MSKIIGVMSKKGGSGKTTVAFNLSYALAMMDYRVLSVDADITEALTEYTDLLAEREELNFDCLKRVRKLDDKKLYKGYDFTIIDANPTLDAIQKEIILVADAVIIPVVPADSADFTQAIKQVKTALEGKKIFRPELKIFMLITRLRTNTKNGQAIMEQLNSLCEFGVEILDTTIGDRTSFQSPRQGTIFQVDRYNKGCKEILSLTKELIKKA